MDGIAQVYDTNAAHGPITADVVDAILTDAPAGKILVGKALNHRNSLFKDGDPIWTTPIVATYPGDVFATFWGAYRVVSWWKGAGRVTVHAYRAPPGGTV